MRSSAIVLCAVLLHAGFASACKPAFHQASDYGSGRIPDHAVFIGKVRSVEEHRFVGSTVQAIRMDVVQWLSGAAAGNVVEVRGATGTYAGTDCAGQFDFSAKVGQQWLVFGQRYEGAVNPDTALSRLAPDGRAPAEVLRALRAPAMRPAVLADPAACRPPRYPRASLRIEEPATTALALLVGKDGRVSAVRVTRSSGYRELDRAAGQAFEQCRYKPVIENGIPVAAWVQWPYLWTLE